MHQKLKDVVFKNSIEQDDAAENELPIWVYTVAFESLNSDYITAWLKHFFRSCRHKFCYLLSDLLMLKMHITAMLLASV